MKWELNKDIGSMKVLEASGFEESGATIYITADGSFDLYEIGCYGGEECFNGNFKDVNDAIKEAESWT